MKGMSCEMPDQSACLPQRHASRSFKREGNHFLQAPLIVPAFQTDTKYQLYFLMYSITGHGEYDVTVRRGRDEILRRDLN